MKADFMLRLCRSLRIRCISYDAVRVLMYNERTTGPPCLIGRQRLYPTFQQLLPFSSNDGRSFSSQAEKKKRKRKRKKLPTFGRVKNLDPSLKMILADTGFQTMTKIQAATWDMAAAGKDVVGRARTGTGKTMAFLLPSVQRILHNPLEDSKVNLLVISPTRELANQIADQARIFERLHKQQQQQQQELQPPKIRCQVVFGGVPKRRDVKQMEAEIPNILVGTPGRLLDHLDSTILHGTHFRGYVDQVQTLVLDEMDRLLEMGFREDIRDIVSLLPKERQTLLFSATMPDDVKHMIEQIARPDYILVDCIVDKDPMMHANQKIQQSHVMLPPDRLVLGVAQIILNFMKAPRHKILVFFPTTSQVTYFSDLFNIGFGRRVLDIHSKKDQTSRSITSEQFRHAEQAVMFTSDVSARGVDYPDVTHVIQIGAANDRKTYIHRIGRTARVGKKGTGILVLMEAEKAFLSRDLDGLDVPALSAMLNRPLPADLEADMMRFAKEMRAGENDKLVQNAKELYLSLFGYYASRLRAWGVNSKTILIEMMNAFAAQSGLHEMPAIPEKLAKQVGVIGDPSVKILTRTRWTAGRLFDVGQARVQTSEDNGSGCSELFGISSEPK